LAIAMTLINARWNWSFFRTVDLRHRDVFQHAKKPMLRTAHTHGTAA
jgi:hypothetical protein